MLLLWTLENSKSLEGFYMNMCRFLASFLYSSALHSLTQSLFPAYQAFSRLQKAISLKSSLSFPLSFLFSLGVLFFPLYFHVAFWVVTLSAPWESPECSKALRTLGLQKTRMVTCGPSSPCHPPCFRWLTSMEICTERNALLNSWVWTKTPLTLAQSKRPKQRRLLWCHGTELRG